MTYKLLLRFSLRSLFISITVVAVILGTWLQRAKQQRRAVGSLEQIELCRIGYEWRDLGNCISSRENKYPDTWIERSLGIDSIHSVTNVEIPVDRLERAMPYLKELPALKKIFIYPYDASSAREEAKQLRKGFSTIRESLPRVRASQAPSCPITVTTIPVVG